MEFNDAVRARRMVRAYRPDPVDPEALRRMLDAARHGPSAGFAQGQTFVVLTAEEDRRRLAELCGEDDYAARGFDRWISTAPVHVVSCVSRAAYERRYGQPDKAASIKPADWRVPFWWVDGGAALMLLLLAAVDEGLAAGFQQLPGTAEVRGLLDLRDDEEPLGLVTIGHPAPDRPSGSVRRGRVPFHEQVRFR